MLWVRIIRVYYKHACMLMCTRMPCLATVSSTVVNIHITGCFASLGCTFWGKCLAVDLLCHVGSLPTFGPAAKLPSTNTAPFYIRSYAGGFQF